MFGLVSYAFVLLATLLPIAEATDPDPRARSVQAAPAEGILQVDGTLDEAAWDTAEPAADFLQLEPAEGAPASQQTEVRVLYGENNLYIGAVMYDDEPERIQANLGRRNEENQADWFYVSIDSHLDRQNAYTFGVNAAGVQRDGIQSGRLDSSWDAIWESAVRVAEQGWIAELRIPYAMLRFAPRDEHTWGIQFRRKIPRLSETNEWVLVPESERSGGVVSHYGLLQGLRGISPRRNLQITPYTVSRLHTQEGDPGQVQSRADFDVGGDIKYGVSSNFTLDATINPDFGQVESDPAELNLSAFETFFDERRPFFIEGMQIFDYDQTGRGAELLYTRRIGATAPVIGASKLSGRTEDGLSIGLLGAATGHRLSPERYYSVARLQQEIGTQSRVGGLVTGFNAPAADGRRTSVAGGLDWDIRLADNTYRLDGSASLTHRRLPQDESNRTGYSGSLSFNQIRGHFRPWAGVSFIDHRFNPNDLGSIRGGDYVRVNGGLDHRFNNNEPIGPFQWVSADLTLSHSWSYSEGLSRGLGTFGTLTANTRNFQRISFDIRSDYLVGGYDLFETRGLGPRAKPRTIDLEFSFSTDDRRNWELRPELSLDFESDGGREYGLELDADWNLGSRISLSGGIEYGWEQNITDWASNETLLPREGQWLIGAQSGAPGQLEPGPCVPDAEEPTRYCSIGSSSQLDAILSEISPVDSEGHRYVPIYGRRDTRSLDISLRGSMTFIPNLTLQLYGQLFIARGQYDDFHILQDPDTLAPFDDYPKQHDFALSSFISNMVLRWEFHPGSTLYLVWSQDRQQDIELMPFEQRRSPYRTPTMDQIGDTFGLFPSNVFLIKLNYTFLG